MLMAHQILGNLAEEIRGSIYALICDEYTDISNKEQLTLCLRWIDTVLVYMKTFWASMKS